MRDYTYFRREEVSSDVIAKADWTAFISAYNSSRRVAALWELVPSCAKRLWAIHREYDYSEAELPDGDSVLSKGCDEGQFVSNLLTRLEILHGKSLEQGRLAVDLTGFMRAELICLVRELASRQLGPVDFLYTEPVRYKKKGWTEFSQGSVVKVRQVVGCEGVHDPEATNDLLIIGSGYDNSLMSAVAEHKPQAQKALVLGLPSLAPDMYQENVWRISRSSESIGTTGFGQSHDTLFAPANDPFVTAEVLSKYLRHAHQEGGNIYLAPLGTKVQVLGFAIIYAAEFAMSSGPVSVILPFAERYERETSDGVGRMWKFEVDLRNLGAT